MAHKNNAATPQPSPTGLAARLQACQTKAGGQKALAAAAGLSKAQLYRYQTGASGIPADKLLAIAQAAEIDAGWLLTGHGSPAGTTLVPDSLRYSPGLLPDISRTLDETLLDYPRRLSPARRSRYLELILLHTLKHQIGGPLSRSLMLNYLDFLHGLPDDDALHLYTQAMLAADGAAPPLNAINHVRFAELIHNATSSLYAGTSGELFYRHLTTQVGSSGQHRLLNLISLAHQHWPGHTQLQVLDIGAGTGRDILFLSKHQPHWQLYGIDAAPRAATAWANNNPGSRITWHTAPVWALPLPAASMHIITSVMSAYLLPHLSGSSATWEGMLAEVSRVLQPGGLLSLHTVAGQGQIYLPFMQLMDTETLAHLATTHGLKLLSCTETPTENLLTNQEPNTKKAPGFERILAAVLQKI